MAEYQKLDQAFLKTDKEQEDLLETKVRPGRGHAIKPKELNGEKQLGHYTLLEPIGFGGMGTVYRSVQNELGRIVAVKVLQKGFLATESQRARFRSEASTAAGLDHPNIVRVIEQGEVEGNLFYSMEFVDGTDLGKSLEKEGPFAPRKTVEKISQAADALQYAHERGVIHRDIKPANLIDDCNGVIRVVDFGLARYVDETMVITRTGDRLGTLTYMSPESLRDSSAGVSVESDIYSLGATFFHMLTGRPPSIGTTALELEKAVLAGNIVRPEKINDQVDQGISAIVMKCLEYQPRHRYQSAADLSADLRRYLKGEAIEAKPRSWFFSTTERLFRNWVPKPIAALLVMCFALVAINGSLEFSSSTVATSKKQFDAPANLYERIKDSFSGKTSKLIRAMNCDAKVTCVECSPDGKQFAFGSQSGKLTVGATSGGEGSDKLFSEMVRGVHFLKANSSIIAVGGNKQLLNPVITVESLGFTVANNQEAKFEFGKRDSIVISGDNDSILHSLLSIKLDEIEIKSNNIHCGNSAVTALSDDQRIFVSVGGTAVSPMTARCAVKVFALNPSNSDVELNLLQTLETKFEKVDQVVVSKHGTTIALRSKSGQVKVWNKSGPSWTRIVDASIDIKCDSVTVGEKTVFLAVKDQSVRRVDLADPDSPKIHQSDFHAKHIQFLDERSLLVGITDNDEVIQFCDADTFDVLGQTKLPEAVAGRAVTGFGFSKNGRRLVLSSDQSVFIVDTAVNHLIKRDPMQLAVIDDWDAPTFAPVFLNDGYQLRVVSRSKNRATAKIQLYPEPMTVFVESTGLSMQVQIPNEAGDRWLVGNGERLLGMRMHSKDGITEIPFLKDGDGYTIVEGMAVAESGVYVAIPVKVGKGDGYGDSYISVRDLTCPADNPNSFWTINCNPYNTQAIAFSPDSRFLLHGGWNDYVVVRQVENRFDSVMSSFVPPNPTNGRISKILFSPNGEQVAIAQSKSVTIAQWNEGVISSPRLFEVNDSHIYDLAFSPHGESIAVAGNTGDVKVWNTSTMKQVRKYEGHILAATGLAWSDCGSMLVSTSEDCTLRVWATGK